MTESNHGCRACAAAGRRDADGSLTSKLYTVGAANRVDVYRTASSIFEIGSCLNLTIGQLNRLKLIEELKLSYTGQHYRSGLQQLPSVRRKGSLRAQNPLVPCTPSVQTALT